MNFFESFVSPRASTYVGAILNANFLGEGQAVDIFTKEFEDEFNLKNVLMLNSCTSALHLALLLAGVNQKSEVILPAQTFVATGLAILYCRAKPVFADVKMDGNINPGNIEKLINKKTKAVIGVDWGGLPCDYDEISEICKRNNISFILDAAHSIGGIYKNTYTGNHADFTCFSFQSIKHLTTGDGGALVCKNTDHYREAKKMKWFGIDREENKFDNLLGERVYNLEKIGYKYHMNNISAAMGIANLETLKQRIRYRRFLARIYNEIFHINNSKDVKSSYWLYPVVLDNRNEIIELMKKYKIPTSVVHQGIDRNIIFGGKNKELEVQRYLDEHMLHFPIHEKVTIDDVYNIMSIYKRGW